MANLAVRHLGVIRLCPMFSAGAWSPVARCTATSWLQSPRELRPSGGECSFASGCPRHHP
ncbi:hypothetical protein FRC11_007142, partial [Ceratobasidium sp. 423]